GAAGTRIGAWLCRAPGLDLVVSLVTWIPPTVLGILLGWRGVVGSIIGQVLGMLVWMFAHELANRKRVNGPRIVTFLNRTVGRLPPEGTMGDVVATLEKMYGPPATADLPRDQRHPWFGHPVRMTVEGRATDVT